MVCLVAHFNIGLRTIICASSKIPLQPSGRQPFRTHQVLTLKEYSLQVHPHYVLIFGHVRCCDGGHAPERESEKPHVVNFHR